MAGWWDRHVVPKIIGCCCCQPPIMELREKLVPRARGRVLELGAGGGANFALYDRAKVSSLTGIDPSAELIDMARERAHGGDLAFDIRQGVGEDMPFENDSFDTVVATYTLCSVDDPVKVLAEVRRVLKPGGTYLFLEHGQSPDAGPRKWQGRIEPLWKRLMGNCHLTRDAFVNVQASGLQIERQDSKYMDGMPRWASWMQWGEAVRT